MIPTVQDIDISCTCDPKTKQCDILGDICPDSLLILLFFNLDLLVLWRLEGIFVNSIGLGKILDSETHFKASGSMYVTVVHERSGWISLLSPDVVTNSSDTFYYWN